MSSHNHEHESKPLDPATWDALKAAGFTDDELHEDQPFGPLIYSYTRQQAIEDGVLVDLTQPTLKPMLDMLGFKTHVAITSTAFAETVGDPDEEAAGGKTDFLRRLWNVLTCLRAAARGTGGNTDRVHFSVAVGANTVKLWSLCGPGDHAEPVLTIMLEGED